MPLASKAAVDRLKRAYHANRIPVDSKTEGFLYTLTADCLRETAEWWEARAAGENPATRKLSIVEAHDVYLNARGPAPCGTRAGVIIDRVELRYHGSRIDIRDSVPE